MAERKNTILVIDPDPSMRGMLAEGVLEASGLYHAIEASDGAQALSLLMAEPIDLIIMELDMPGFSGKDLMVALSSQGINTPVIVTTHQGGDALAVEAFRLGAKDYFTKPFREAEVVAALERVLTEIRLRYERDHLTGSLQNANQILEQRLSEERTLFAIGKSVTSTANLDQLLTFIVEAAVYLTNADFSATLLRDDQSGALILRSGKNLPAHLAEQMGHAIGDDLASLVMTSGEPLLASGDGLARFKPPHDSHSVIYVPLMVGQQQQQQAIGVLWVANQTNQTEFIDRQRELLLALADYAAIAVVNARLISMMDQRAKRIEQAYEEVQAQKTDGQGQITQVAGTIGQYLSSVRNDLSLLRRVANMEEMASLDVLDRRLGELLNWLAGMVGTNE